MYLIEKEDLFDLISNTYILNALFAEGLQNWPHYYDALDASGVMEWNEEEGIYEPTDKVIKILSEYPKGVDKHLLETLRDTFEYKMEIYENKDTQYSKGCASAFTFAYEKLRGVIDGD